MPFVTQSNTAQHLAADASTKRAPLETTFPSLLGTCRSPKKAGARLVCSFAKGVNLASVSEQGKVFLLDADLILGRDTPSMKTLVPDTVHRSRISRDHFKVSWRDGDEKGFVLTCLSNNGVVYNGHTVRDKVVSVLTDGDSISFETIESESEPVRFVTFHYEEASSYGPQFSLPVTSQDDAFFWCRDGPGRTIHVPTDDGAEFIMGREGKYASIWERWVPSNEERKMISREHFKVRCRMSSSGAQLFFYVSCLSNNGMTLNGKYMESGHAEVQLKVGDTIELLMASKEGITCAERKPIVVLQFGQPGPASFGGRSRTGAKLKTAHFGGASNF
jgi:hypothetical protein